jgi:TPR repeat protein
MYYHGRVVAQDNRRAVPLFEKAAGAGDIQSAFNPGKSYPYGIGMEQDERLIRGADLRLSGIGRTKTGA